MSLEIEEKKTLRRTFGLYIKSSEKLAIHMQKSSEKLAIFI